MNTPTLLERRRLTTARRHRPGGPTAIVFRATDGGVHGADKPPRPTDLHLETTHADGTLVEWFNDNWWLETIRRWKDRPLTIHIQRTPAALLHDDVAYELEMVRRMETPWRLIGHCYLSDIGRLELMRKLAVNHYDEVRIIDGPRPPTDVFNVSPAELTLTDVFQRIRDIQALERVSRPLLTRAPDPDIPRPT